MFKFLVQFALFQEGQYKSDLRHLEWKILITQFYPSKNLAQSKLVISFLSIDQFVLVILGWKQHALGAPIFSLLAEVCRASLASTCLNFELADIKQHGSHSPLVIIKQLLNEVCTYISRRAKTSIPRCIKHCSAKSVVV